MKREFAPDKFTPVMTTLPVNGQPEVGENEVIDGTAPAFLNTEVVPDVLFPITKSNLVSPSISAIAKALGKVPVTKSTFGAILLEDMPLPVSKF